MRAVIVCVVCVVAWASVARAQPAPAWQVKEAEKRERDRQACDAGQPQACVELGYAVSSREPERATRLYARACTAGLADGCWREGLMIADQGQGDATPAAAALLFVRACDADQPRACADLGERGGPEATHAMRRYGRGCAAGDDAACARFETVAASAQHDPHPIIDDGGPNLDPRPWPTVPLPHDLHGACDRKIAAACFNLALSEPASAVTMFRRACELGSGDACFALGARRVPALADLVDSLADRCANRGRMECLRLARIVGGWRYGTRGERTYPCPTVDCGLVAPEIDAIATWSDQTRSEDAARCDRGQARGCVDLGRNLVQGFDRDLAAAAAAFGRACDRADAEGCVELAKSYASPIGAGLDIAGVVRAGALVRRACELGSPDGCDLYVGTLGPIADPHVAQLLAVACDRNGRTSCYALGKMLEDGRGVPQDLAAAAQRFAHACDGRVPAACVGAAAFFDGPSAYRNAQLARSMLADACQGGDAHACGRFAALVRAMNPTLGWQRLERHACGLGDGDACHDLAQRYTTGDGVAIDADEAALLEAKACARGYACGHGR